MSKGILKSGALLFALAGLEFLAITPTAGAQAHVTLPFEEHGTLNKAPTRSASQPTGTARCWYTFTAMSSRGKCLLPSLRPLPAAPKWRTSCWHRASGWQALHSRSTDWVSPSRRNSEHTGADELLQGHSGQTGHGDTCRRVLGFIYLTGKHRAVPGGVRRRSHPLLGRCQRASHG